MDTAFINHRKLLINDAEAAAHTMYRLRQQAVDLERDYILNLLETRYGITVALQTKHNTLVRHKDTNEIGIFELRKHREKQADDLFTYVHGDVITKNDATGELRYWDIEFHTLTRGGRPSAKEAKATRDRRFDTVDEFVKEFTVLK